MMTAAGSCRCNELVRRNNTSVKGKWKTHFVYFELLVSSTNMLLKGFFYQMHPTHSIWVGSLTILLRLSFIPRKTRNLQQNQNKEPKLLISSVSVSNVLDIQSLSITIFHFSLHENISFLRCEDNSDIIRLHRVIQCHFHYILMCHYHYTLLIWQTSWRSGATLKKVSFTVSSEFQI